MSGRYIKQEPYVDNHGIYMPVNEYVPEGSVSMYKCIMTKEMFVEAYNKWIKKDVDKYSCDFVGEDDADCWSDD
jgi:hypothetical protein